jgi:endo-1,4-beta-xylanase
LVRDIDAMGLRLMVTELEVIDQFLPADFATRDAIAAELVETFLQTVCAGAIQPAAILSWGISDKYTWMRIYRKRLDGLPNRPLPLDAALHPKKMLAVIRRFAGEKVKLLPE